MFNGRYGFSITAIFELVLLSTIVRAAPVSWERSFTVTAASTGTSVTAVFHGNSLYCLVCNIQANGCTVEKRALDGSEDNASWPLPSGMAYGGIGVRDSGNVIIRYRRGRESGISEFDKNGKQLRMLVTGVQTRSNAVASNLYMAANIDGSLEIRDLGGPTPEAATTYPNVFEHRTFVRAETTANNEVAFINQNTAKLVTLNLQSGPTATYINAPEVQASVCRYAQIAQSAPPGTPPPRGLVVVATGNDGIGNIYAMASPWRAETGAPILTLTAQGNVTNTRYYKLPDRGAMPQYSTPVEIGAYANELFIVFGQGGVLAYPRVGN